MMTKEEVHEAIDRLNEDQLRPVATLLEELLPSGKDKLWEQLKGIAGIRLPAHWPPRFGPVERAQVEGEMASERLIRERR